MGKFKSKHLICWLFLIAIFLVATLSPVVVARLKSKAKGRGISTDTSSTKGDPKSKKDSPKTSNWCYMGPECDQKAKKSDWNTGDCKFGKSQSPINIDSKNEVKMAGKGVKLKQKSLQMEAKDVANFAITNFEMTNTGSTVALSNFTTETGKPPSFTWPDTIDSFYILDKVVYHWGPNATWGSEHTLDGKYFAGEIQLIFYRSDKGPDEDGYANYDAAVESGERDAVAIISFLLKSFRGLKSGTIFDPIVANLKEVEEKDSKVTVNSALKLNDLLSQQSSAYSYMGSLTTPPCREVVAWLVCMAPVKAREEDLMVLRMALKEMDQPLKHNLRNRQNVEGTQVQNRPFKVVKLKKYQTNKN